MSFDFKNPDYVAVLRERALRLRAIREGRVDVAKLKAYYKTDPAQFIDDWGMTVDPRNIEKDRPALVPFKLFPLQRQWVGWLVEQWRAAKPGIVEKSRDMGLSWLMVSTAVTLCVHYDGMAIGFGSRKEEYVDASGDPKSLFFKARAFAENLPLEFRGGWTRKKDAHMRLTFGATGATMTGEAGDNIGRGDRTAIYFVDEAAHIARPQLVDASLSQTTNCRIDVSSVNGPANSFAIRRHKGTIRVFTFHWRDDPRKDDAWYQKQNEELDPVVVAQEIDIDYQASNEGAVIKSAWVQAAIDAHVKLSLSAQGRKTSALDIADEGDANAWACGRDFLIEGLAEWSGKNSDPYASAVRAFGLCDEHGVQDMLYDADGLGASVKGDSRMIGNDRAQRGLRSVNVTPFRGSWGVLNPAAEDVKGIRNEDFFANYKAQSWWSLRTRFYKTWRAVTEGAAYRPEELISIPSGLKHREKLVMELAQPTYKRSDQGKLIVEKKPDGAKSPNLADAVMMLKAPRRKSLEISDALIVKSMAPSRQTVEIASASATRY